MSNEIQIFNSPEFGDVRVVNLDGEPWLVGVDVTTKLGYQNGSRDINRHVDAEDRQNYQDGTFDSPRGMTIINESGLYSLVFGSKLPEAKRFKHWVTSEVLPAIRKTGSYGRPMSQLDILVESAKALQEQERRLNAVEKRMDGIHDVLALSPNGWRKDSANLINRIAATLGGPEHIQPIRAESYKFLNERMHVDLAARLRNMKRKAADEGVCKTKRERFNYLDVISQDPKLIEGYTIIIKDMAVSYGVTVADKEN